ncbi:hypothetical protein GWK47_019230 [Chionoecetes opilio]|uniref:Uncharacterized protein n=1 Tax=Chionoecetes opilio TaxID=41210 RepID=A0A8J5BXF4_CHIOP|nr:hypothetical protein GWK47_019230 [Chionoecetes opilio]
MEGAVSSKTNCSTIAAAVNAAAPFSELCIAPPDGHEDTTRPNMTTSPRREHNSTSPKRQLDPRKKTTDSAHAQKLDNFKQHFCATRQARDSTAETSMQWFEGGGRSGIREKIIAFVFDTTASNTRDGQGACIRIENRTRTKRLWLAAASGTTKVILKMSPPPRSPPRLFLLVMTDFESSNDSVIAMVLGILAERDGPANHFRRPGALHQDRCNGKASTPQASDAEIPAVADCREKAGWNEWPSSLLWCTAKQWHEAPISVKIVEHVLFLRSSRHTDDNKPLPRQQYKPCGRTPVVRFEKKPGLAFFDSRIDVEEKKQMVKHLDKPPQEEGTQAMEGKKMTMSLPPSFVTSKDTVFFQKTRRGRDLLQRTGIGERTTISRTLRTTGHLPRSGQRCAERGIALVPSVHGSTKSSSSRSSLTCRSQLARRQGGRAGSSTSPCSEAHSPARAACQPTSCRLTVTTHHVTLPCLFPSTATEDRSPPPKEDARMPPAASRYSLLCVDKKRRKHPGVRLQLFPKDARRDTNKKPPTKHHLQAAYANTAYGEGGSFLIVKRSANPFVEPKNGAGPRKSPSAFGCSA